MSAELIGACLGGIITWIIAHHIGYKRGLRDAKPTFKMTHTIDHETGPIRMMGDE